MLVHPSQRIKDHKKVFDKMDDLMSQWRLKTQNINDISFNELKRLLRDAYLKYTSESQVNVSFEELLPHVLTAINECGLHVVNGEQVSNNADKFHNFNIYLGGNILGRGLTLKGLAITYIIRTAKGKSNVDTVEQRARWFGYKSNYIDICRVFAPEKILTQFSYIRDHETDLWETVRLAGLQGTRFKNIKRIFILNSDMKLTRSNVAQTRSYSYSFWNFQRSYQDEPAAIQSNKNIIETFKSLHAENLSLLEFGKGSQPHKVLYGLDFEDVNKDLLQKFVFPSQSGLNCEVINKLHSILKAKGILSKIDVIWMRDGIPAVHPVNSGIVSEYMVGRRPQDESLPVVYKGDRYMLEKPDVMQLQIHEINKKGTDISSPTLALYIPIDYMGKITDLVIRE